MKRKLIAIFAACLTLTCALASCGDKDESDSEKSSRKKNSSSDVSDISDKDEDDDDNDDDDDDKDKDDNDDDDEKAPVTTKPDKKKKDKTTTTTTSAVTTTATTAVNNDDNSNNGNSGEVQAPDPETPPAAEATVEGVWEGDIDGDTGRYIFDSNGKFSMSMIWSEYLRMEGSTCYIGDEDVTPYLKYNGYDFILEENGTEVINMQKTEPTDSSDFNGEYYIKSGYLADILESSFGSEQFDISIIFDDNVTFFSINDIADYEVSGDKIVITNMPASMSENGETTAEMNFELNGDSLTITDTDGEVLEFTRVK
jgi:phosphopantothenoylcysteine decarboxylase subunit VHS3